VINEWRIGKDLEESGSGLILRYCLGIRVERLKKTTKNFSQDSLSPGRGLSLGSTEYEVLSRHSRRGTDKSHEKPQSGYPVSGPRFEPGIYRIRSRSVNHRPRRSVTSLAGPRSGQQLLRIIYFTDLTFLPTMVPVSPRNGLHLDKLTTA
jgi:hypothetical protein